MDAHTNVEALELHVQHRDARRCRSCSSRTSLTKVPIPIPIPDITPLNPPLGLIPPIPKNFEIVTDTAKYSPAQAALIGLTKAAKSADAVTGERHLDVTALRPGAEGAPARRRARRRARRSTVCTT